MKRHILFLGAIVSFIALFTACSGGSSTKSGLSVDYIPFAKEEDGAIGMLDKDLKPLFAEEFEGEVSPVIDGVFWVREERGNYSLYKAGKKPTVIKGCEDLVGVGIMSEGIIPIVKKGSRITYVDKNGKEKFTLKPYKGKEIVSVAPYFRGGKAWICVTETKERIERNPWNGREYRHSHTEALYGVINKEGKVIVEPIYDEVNLYEDFILVQKGAPYNGDEEYSTILLDNNGKKVKEFKNKRTSNDYFIANKGQFMLVSKNSIHLYNKSGEELKKFSEKKEVPFIISGDYCVYIDYKKSALGIKNFKDNKIIIRPKYKMIFPVDENTFVVMRDSDDWRLIDKEDKEIKAFEGEYDGEIGLLPLGFWMKAFGFNSDGWEDYIVGIEQGSQGFIQIFNKKGEVISDGEYHFDAYESFAEILGFDRGSLRSDYQDAVPASETATEFASEVEEYMTETATETVAVEYYY